MVPCPNRANVHGLARRVFVSEGKEPLAMPFANCQSYFSSDPVDERRILDTKREPANPNPMDRLLPTTLDSCYRHPAHEEKCKRRHDIPGSIVADRLPLGKARMTPPASG